MLTNEQTALVLTEARKLLDTKGWVKGAYGVDLAGRSIEDYTMITANGVSCLCSLGAAIAAAREMGWISTNYPVRDSMLIENAVSEAFNIKNVAEWNDEEDRTKEQVLAKFDTTIEKLAA